MKCVDLPHGAAGTSAETSGRMTSRAHGSSRRKFLPVLIALLPLAARAPLPWSEPGKKNTESWTTGARGAAKAVAADEIARAISDNTVVIFSRTKCGGCDKVKGYFEEAGIPYYALELDTRADGEAIIGELAKKDGSSKSLPAVYIRGQRVSGWEVGKAYSSGELGHWTDT